MKYNPLLHGSSRSWDMERKPAKGGGGDQAYYENANRLYGVQADTAQYMLGIGQNYLPGAVSNYADAANRYSDPAYEAQMVGKANTDAQQAIAQNTAAMNRNMASYGLNPASGRYGAMMNQNAIGNAATQVGASNNARQYVQDKQFGASKDFYSSMIGINSDAASMAGQSAGGFANMGAQNAQNQQSFWGNVGAAGMMGMDMYSQGMFKDGGKVNKKEPGYATGGLFGGGQQGGLMGGAGAMPPPPPPGPGAPQPDAGSGAMAAMKGYRQGMKMQGIGNRLANKWGMNNVSGSGAAASDMGLSSGNTATAGLGAQDAAFMGEGAGMTAETAAATMGGEQAAMLAAQDAAFLGGAEAAGGALAAETAAAAGATEAAAGLASSGALGAVGAAMPWVGAALAVGSMFGLFAQGGKVEAPPKGIGKDDTFSKKAQVYQQLFGKPYIGSAEQDDAVREVVSEQLVRGFGGGEQPSMSYDMYGVREKLNGRTPLDRTQYEQAKEQDYRWGNEKAVSDRIREYFGYADGGKVSWQTKLRQMIYKTPDERYAEYQASGSKETPPQKAKAEEQKRDYEYTQYGKGTALERRMKEQGLAKGGKARKNMKKGGAVDGPGTETSDSVPARLSDGEFVVNADAVKMPGMEELLTRINNMGLQRRYGGLA